MPSLMALGLGISSQTLPFPSCSGAEAPEEPLTLEDSLEIRASYSTSGGH